MSIRDEEYEYEPRGIFGTGQASPIQQYRVRTPRRALGLLAARERSMPHKSGMKSYPASKGHPGKKPDVLTKGDKGDKPMKKK